MAIDLNVSGATPFFYILIGGIGIKEGTEAKQLYTFTRKPDWTPSATQKFIDGLYIPAEWSQGVDLWGGVASGSNLTLEIQDFQQADGTNYWATLFALGRWQQADPSFVPSQCQPVQYPQTFVTETCRPIDLALWVQDASSFATASCSAADRTIFVGLETMRYSRWVFQDVYGSADVPGDTRFNTYAFVLSAAARNLFPAIGDLPLEHAVQSIGTAQQPVVTTVPRNLFGRTVGLYCGLQYPDGSWSVEADSLRLFGGTIQQAEWISERGVWRLQCDDMLSLLDQRCCSYIGRRRGPLIESGPEPTGVVASSRVRGITLSRNDDTTVLDGEPGETDNRIHYRARLFGSPHTLIADVNSNVRTFYKDSAALHRRLVEILNYENSGQVRFDIVLGENKWLIAATAIGVDLWVRLVLGKALAFQLGFTDGQHEYNNLMRVDADTTEQWEPDTATATDCFWSRALEYNRKITLSHTSWFLPSNPHGQGDGVFPAVLIGGDRLMRYNGKGVHTALLDPGANLDDWHSFTGLEYLNAAQTTISGVAGDYGAFNKWPGAGWGAARRYGEDEGGEVVQVLAPNPEKGLMVTLLQLMMSTGYGSYTVGQDLGPLGGIQTTPLNGPYDVFPSGIGAAIPAALIDAQSFLDVASQFDAALLRRSFVFMESFPLRELVDREAKIVGFTVSIVNGRITARIVPSLATIADPVATLDESNRTSDTDRTSSRLDSKSVLNSIALQSGYHIKDKTFLRTTNVNFPVSQTENRAIRAVALESKGLYTGALADAVATNLTLRQVLYGYPLWTLRRSYVYRLWTTLAPGQIVYITDGRVGESGVPDPFTGKLGLLDRYAAVTSCAYNYKGGGGSVELVLLTMQGRTKTTGTVLEVNWTRLDGGWEEATGRVYVLSNTYTVPPAHDLDMLAEGMRLRISDLSHVSAETLPSAVVVVAGTIVKGDDSASYFTIEGQDLNALMPGGFIANQRYVAVEDEGATVSAPVSTVFYFRDALATGSNFGQMTKDDSSGISIAMTATGWTVGTTTPVKNRALQYGAEVAGFGSSVPAVGPPDNALANCWRSQLPLSGTVPAGNWTLATWVRAVTAGSTMDGAMASRIYRGTSADGSGATEITGGVVTGSTVTNLTTAADQLSSAVAAIGDVVLDSEYLFVSMTWILLGAGSGATDDCLIKVGNPSGTWTSLTIPGLALPAAPTPGTRSSIVDADTSGGGLNIWDWDPFT